MPIALLPQTPVLELMRPMAGVVTQGVHGNHPAIDIACVEGTPVFAAHDGQGSTQRSYTHGVVFVLARPDGLETSYAHLTRAQPPGNYRRGDLIGHCGNTGAWSSGAHLHFESNRPELLNALAEPSSIGQGPIGGSPLPLNSSLLNSRR